MTKDQYKQKKKEIEDEARVYMTNLQYMYANANNPYKRGDRFTDHMGSIIIESWELVRATGYDEFPSLRYFGTNLRKDGKPSKVEPTRHAWQMNDINLKK